jgi:uncharacterized protein (TIGR03382 family)
MSYVDAGYAIALVVLALYAVSLLSRRRRLERAVARGAGGRDAATLDGTAPEHVGGHDTVRADDAATHDPLR